MSDELTRLGELGPLIDAATDSIVTADERGVIVSWNPAAERTFGYTALIKVKGIAHPLLTYGILDELGDHLVDAEATPKRRSKTHSPGAPAIEPGG